MNLDSNWFSPLSQFIGAIANDAKINFIFLKNNCYSCNATDEFETAFKAYVFRTQRLKERFQISIFFIFTCPVNYKYC